LAASRDLPNVFVELPGVESTRLIVVTGGLRQKIDTKIVELRPKISSVYTQIKDP
jgi:hypothetical protein